MNKILFLFLPGLVSGAAILVLFLALGRWRRIVTETGKQPRWSW